jgi:formylglycine-generating enzyme required for sulfatase activity
MPDSNVPAALAALGKFEVLGKLGQGGMGAVYKARRTLLQDIVAIKVMGPEVAGNPDARARFLREMRATVRLNHPHIVRAFDAEEVGDLLYLVMEYVEGISLQKLVKQKGPVPAAYACRWVAQAAEGLQHAHERGMVHRDVKPANLMLTAKDKAVKVLDFGLVQVPRGQGASLAKTAFETFLGTPEYVAPEQATDAKRADIRSDVYSLGCTLYFLLTGRPPFQAETVLNMILAHLQEDPAPLAKVRADAPAGLSAAVARMLAKKPEDRYRTPAEVAEALRPFTTGGRKQLAVTEAEIEAPVATPPPLPEGFATAFDVNSEKVIGPRRPPRAGNRKWRVVLLVGGAAAALVFALVTAVILLTGGERTRRESQVKPSQGKEKDAAGKLNQGGEVPALAKEVENSIGMRLVKLPTGTFWMGSPEGAPGRAEDEGPRHEVEISEFYLGVYEVTQAEYEKVTGTNPSWFSANGGGRGKVARMDTRKFPVENVSWEGAMAFCEKLNKEDRKRPNGWVYRQPTEAEWEYACRGGARLYQAFHFGDGLSSDRANFDGKMPFGDAGAGDDLGQTTNVGSYRPNDFGLFDMHGNVWEWCADWYGKDFYKASPRRDPPGPSEGTSRVFRGGSWSYDGKSCRSAHRAETLPSARSPDLGFRVALVPAERK